MKPLYESLLDIGPIETETNVVKYLSYKEFQELYKRKLKSVIIDDNNQVCIIEEYDGSMQELCKKFNAKIIDLSGVYPESKKIKEMYNFVSDCKNLINFIGPNAHENYSEIESLDWFFSMDKKLKTFNLEGLAKSIKKLKYIEYMFAFCFMIESIDLSNFNLISLINADWAFGECINLKQINLGDSNAIIENSNNMCRGNIKLKEFNAPNMILSGECIFYDCESLKNINVKYIDVSKSYYEIFYNCTKLENVKIYGLNGKSNSLDFSWAVSLNDKSWDFLFMNLGDGNKMKLKLPDTPKKEWLIKKYDSIAKKYNFKLV